MNKEGSFEGSRESFLESLEVVEGAGREGRERCGGKVRIRNLVEELESGRDESGLLGQSRI